MNRVSSRVVFEKTQDAQCIQRCIVQANMQNRYDSRINASISFFYRCSHPLSSRLTDYSPDFSSFFLFPRIILLFPHILRK